MPNSFERRMCASSFAVRMRAFDGTQPVLRQSPPMRCFSTSVTFAFTAAAMYAVTSPAEPAPITTTLRSKRAGRGHFAYTLRALSASRTFFATMGKMPRITNAATRPIEILNCPSWVPAYT